MTNRMVHVLVVEDDRMYQWVLVKRLQAVAGFTAFGVETLAQAIAEFASKCFDAVLLDIHLPDSPANRTVARMKQEHPECAVVVLSGNEDPDQIKRSISQSASNYLIKGRDDLDADRLANAIRTAIDNNSTSVKADKLKRELENGYSI